MWLFKKVRKEGNKWIYGRDVCVCVSERERVCVCVRERERERERKREREVLWKERATNVILYISKIYIESSENFHHRF